MVIIKKFEEVFFMLKILKSPLNTVEVKNSIATDGYFIAPNIIDQQTVSRLKSDLIFAIDAESRWHRGTSYADYGMVMNCPMYAKSFIDLLGHSELMSPFNTVLGEGCIIYGYVSSSMPPKGTNYSRRVHVDCPRLIPGYITNMACTIALDDFTLENGATFFLPKSHEMTELPAEDLFYSTASRFVVSAGSVLYFNARLVHAGGVNHTNEWRHGLTMNVCRPWMKQRFDLPNLLANYQVSLDGVSSTALQKLGFYSQPPQNLDEYYAPQELRKFRQPTE